MNSIQIEKGDITTYQVDAIVNAANEQLKGGGGVDGAIHKVAGLKLLEECQKFEGCPTGEARLTHGHGLPSDYVIHTVGPVWHGGDKNEDQLLARAYQSSLELASEHGLKSLAFPAISTGVYGFPLERATKIALETVVTFLEKHDFPSQVTFVCFDEKTYDMYQKLYPQLEVPSSK